jgi:hypothetical protein
MNADTLLLRQVHPTQYPKGELSSGAFRPTKDDQKLSTYDGDLISAEASHAHYVETYKALSCGVWGVSTGEVHGIGLTSVPDPLPESPCHAVVDFVVVPENTTERGLAKLLRDRAEARGCLYTPT